MSRRSTLKTLQEIFELRIALECMAIELATSRADAREAERVRAAYVKAGVRVRKGDSALLAETDEAVHDFGRNCVRQRTSAAASVLSHGSHPVDAEYGHPQVS